MLKKIKWWVQRYKDWRDVRKKEIGYLAVAELMLDPWKPDWTKNSKYAKELYIKNHDAYLDAIKLYKEKYGVLPRVMNQRVMTNVVLKHNN